MSMFAGQDPDQHDCTTLRLAPPGSGLWGRVQPALPELLAAQLALRHSCTHTIVWLSLYPPNESCKARKSVRHTKDCG
ncbi:hypothetical protein EXN66_Car017943 [Channa argus]|uniref:Uncharacterized protein n=1 Tax=Channa argus TaxID=215402 RepID=A0A6G1QI77_CHAAH|nr:hypothetical protein EXN66_Car017943 [Channa argus]